jgi:hypothetical protein
MMLPHGLICLTLSVIQVLGAPVAKPDSTDLYDYSISPPEGEKVSARSTSAQGAGRGTSMY